MLVSLTGSLSMAKIATLAAADPIAITLIPKIAWNIVASPCLAGTIALTTEISMYENRTWRNSYYWCV